MNTVLESAAKKGAENIINRAVNSLVDFGKKKFGEAQVLLGTSFQRYLENADKRYNQVRTLATGTDPRCIIGKNSIYVQIGVKYNDKEISTNTVDPLLRLSNNILILGTGGVGKSMLMRYLFLRTARSNDYVPVLVELRKVSNQPPGNISILELIYSCMQDFDVELPREQFEYSLRSGKYLFLFDGFDEVKEALSTETASAIQAFCAKYPNNSCIMTSRPKQDRFPLETFTIVTSMPLTKEQAVCLASKIWKEDEKTKEFCRQLDDSLYDLHKDFAENPLLLSMMFLTFMRNNSIPDHLADFYKKAYDALYNAHDSSDKGVYVRDFKSKELDESEFRLLLSHFCFQTYFKEKYEFTKEEIINFLEKSIQKLGLNNVSAQDYLADLRNAVCIIIKDGEIYRFSHRSFQAYFAAEYTSNVLTDEQQNRLFHTLLSERRTYHDNADYYELLIQIEPERFAVNALEQGLLKLQKDADVSIEADVFILKEESNAIKIEIDRDRYSVFIPGVNSDYHRFNMIAIFSRYLLTKQISSHNADKYQACINRIKNYYVAHKKERGTWIEYSDIDHLAEKERSEMYSAIACVRGIPRIRSAIREWLLELETKRNSLESPSFIDDL